jgi:hypothetical protein
MHNSKTGLMMLLGKYDGWNIQTLAKGVFQTNTNVFKTELHILRNNLVSNTELHILRNNLVSNTELHILRNNLVSNTEHHILRNHLVSNTELHILRDNRTVTRWQTFPIIKTNIFCNHLFGFV